MSLGFRAVPLAVAVAEPKASVVLRYGADMKSPTWAWRVQLLQDTTRSHFEHPALYTTRFLPVLLLFFHVFPMHVLQGFRTFNVGSGMMCCCRGSMNLLCRCWRFCSIEILWNHPILGKVCQRFPRTIHSNILSSALSRKVSNHKDNTLLARQHVTFEQFWPGHAWAQGKSPSCPLRHYEFWTHLFQGRMCVQACAKLAAATQKKEIVETTTGCSCRQIWTDNSALCNERTISLRVVVWTWSETSLDFQRFHVTVQLHKKNRNAECNERPELRVSWVKHVETRATRGLCAWRCSGWSAEVRCSAARNCKGLHLAAARRLIQTYPNLSGDDWRWSEMGWEILGTWFTNSCVILCLSCLSLNVWKSLDPRHQPIRSNMQSYIYTKLRSYILRLRSLRELICSLDKHGKVECQ